MASSTIYPIFPEDVERRINDTLLDDTRTMSCTMCLLARRFHTWAKPFVFRTITIRKRNPDRMKNLVAIAGFIRVLAINLPLNKDGFSNDELENIRQLTVAGVGSINHLAITWNLWNHFEKELGALRLESLYLIWDFVSGLEPPTFVALQQPEHLKDLTVLAPVNANDITAFQQEGDLYISDLSQCTNLRYVTYASSAYTFPTVASLCEDLPTLEGAMFVLVNIPKEYLDGDSVGEQPEEDETVYAKFSTAYLPHARMVLEEWLAKMDEKQSVLIHPPPHEIDEEMLA